MDNVDYELEMLVNNPNNELTGPYTGRCKKCGSNDLWDDNMAFGCNKCDYIYIGNN